MRLGNAELTKKTGADLFTRSAPVSVELSRAKKYLVVRYFAIVAQKFCDLSSVIFFAVVYQTFLVE